MPFNMTERTLCHVVLFLLHPFINDITPSNTGKMHAQLLCAAQYWDCACCHICLHDTVH